MVLSNVVTVALAYSTNGAAHYAPGVMERVARNRNMSVVDCMISSPYYGSSYLGTWAVVTSNLTGESFKCRFTDVSNKKHIPMQIKRNILIEVNWITAKRMCKISTVNQEPPSACPVTLSLLAPQPKIKQPITTPIPDTGVKTPLHPLKSLRMAHSKPVIRYKKVVAI